MRDLTRTKAAQAYLTAVEELKEENARLREREQTLEDNRTTWMYRAEAAEARVREAREIMEMAVSKDAIEQADYDDMNSWLARRALAHEEEA